MHESAEKNISFGRKREDDQKIQRVSIDRDSNSKVYPTTHHLDYMNLFSDHTQFGHSRRNEVSLSLFCIILRLFRISPTSNFYVQM